MPPVEPYIPPTRRDYYQRPELNYQPPPPRETRIQEPLRCDKCNREAPPGAKEGELCTYCNAGVTLNKVTDSVMTGYRVIRGIILLFTVMALIGSAWAWCKTKLGF